MTTIYEHLRDARQCNNVDLVYVLESGYHPQQRVSISLFPLNFDSYIFCFQFNLVDSEKLIL
jgi:hypothetical protein